MGYPRHLFLLLVFVASDGLTIDVDCKDSMGSRTGIVHVCMFRGSVGASPLQQSQHLLGNGDYLLDDSLNVDQSCFPVLLDSDPLPT